MKITAIDTFTLRAPTIKPIALDIPEQRLVVTRIHTDNGLDGLGYTPVFGGAGSEAVEAYARHLGELLIGKDPRMVGIDWIPEDLFGRLPIDCELKTSNGDHACRRQ